jgi:class 3 adenylate cyclase
MQACPSCGEAVEPGDRFCSACGSPLGRESASATTRKLATLVSTDVRGSTEIAERLDLEAVRDVMERYFQAAREVLESHGGTVEKFVGDAVMAAFGIPTVHEDDALRAVRAAAELREAMAELNSELQQRYAARLEIRTGVNTGEVIAGDPAAGQAFVSGDPVNVAARLEQAAASGEVLIGEPTYRLVRDAVEVKEMEPLELKGKSEPVPAYRLVGVAAEAPGSARRFDLPLIGREDELAELEDLFSRAVEHSLCELITVYAEAGTGNQQVDLGQAEGAPGGAVEHREHPEGHVPAQQRRHHQRLRHVTGLLGDVAGEAGVALDVLDHQRLAGAQDEARHALGRGKAGTDQGGRTLA